MRFVLRAVMRKEAVYTVILNMPLFKGMKCFLAPSDPRYLRFSGLENGTVTHYNLRVSFVSPPFSASASASASAM